DARTSATVATVSAPDSGEMHIEAPQPDWAEQDPELWWSNACRAAKNLLQTAGVSDPKTIAAIGIAYQMHGLVAVDESGKALRPAIIWCDSRAVETGNRAFRALGQSFCLERYLNSPGNFTASKLAWVREHEPERFASIHKIFLPGDYLAFRMTGEAVTTASGLSEGILWDFRHNRPATELLDHFGIPETLLPDIAPTFGLQGKLTAAAAAELGLAAGTPVTYRAGDQPNNALSLNALQPGEVAATGGTSGVVYGVSDHLVFDPQNRVNSFAHVNHSAAQPRVGVLLCINGAGIQYSWMRRLLADEQVSYFELEKTAAQAPPGSAGLRIIPFGNGAERMLVNLSPVSQALNIQVNRLGKPQYFR
ncbi:MAG: carbohydrate kinase, partial [Saprospiraceae bacterium]|nr:carbohydrate kinase [Saprospiraceae bacterium]